jgi:hypothetical protein
LVKLIGKLAVESDVIEMEDNTVFGVVVVVDFDVAVDEQDTITMVNMLIIAVVRQ